MGKRKGQISDQAESCQRGPGSVHCAGAQDVSRADERRLRMERDRKIDFAIDRCQGAEPARFDLDRDFGKPVGVYRRDGEEFAGFHCRLAIERIAGNVLSERCGEQCSRSKVRLQPECPGAKRHRLQLEHHHRRRGDGCPAERHSGDRGRSAVGVQPTDGNHHHARPGASGRRQPQQSGAFDCHLRPAGPGGRQRASSTTQPIAPTPLSGWCNAF